MNGTVWHRGWYCPDCHRMFTTPIRTEDGKRWHNMGCGMPLVRAEVVEVEAPRDGRSPE